MITKKTCDIDDDDKRDKKMKLVTCSLQRDCRLAALGNKDCTTMDSALWAGSMDQWFRAKCDVKHTVVHRDYSGFLSSGIDDDNKDISSVNCGHNQLKCRS